MSKYKFLLGSALSLMALGITNPAQAQTSRLYFAGYMGLNTFSEQGFNERSTPGSGNMEFDNATSFAGALGLRLNNKLRVEAELSYRNAGVSSANISGTGISAMDGELKSKMIFANVYYDFDTPWVFQPYIGAGLGYGWHDGTIIDGSGALTDSRGDDTSILWNLGGGIKYRPNPDLAFTGGYRYIDSTQLSLGTYDMDYSSHEFRVGVEWDLPVAGR